MQPVIAGGAVRADDADPGAGNQPGSGAQGVLKKAGSRVDRLGSDSRSHEIGPFITNLELPRTCTSGLSLAFWGTHPNGLIRVMPLDCNVLQAIRGWVVKRAIGEGEAGMAEFKKPEISEMRPKITVIGVGGGGGNAINNMIAEQLQGTEFIAANTDAQALTMSKATRLIQLGAHVTEGLGAGSLPEIGRAAAEESLDEIMDHLAGTHMCFVTAGMGGGTGTGAAPVIAQAARKAGILTVGVVTKPFTFEGRRRMQMAEEGIERLREAADTVIVIPNQNLFRIADAKTTFADAFVIADRVLYSGVSCITDLIVKEGLINLDFADVKSVMRGMGRAMMGTGEASGESRAMKAAEAAIANPLLDEVSMKGAKGVLVSISGGRDMTLFEVDEAATRIREEVYEDADIIVGAIFDKSMEGRFRVSVVATGLDRAIADADAGVAHDHSMPSAARILQ
ncbi:cell division protein FtsZ [Mesorhizobium sp. B2-1-3A]|uniref:cell division protein FtsZ n=1 Tax=Mesorhizobium sp. B2-1-3A TaxID=2589971 RepID=UPI0032B11EE0